MHSALGCKKYQYRYEINCLLPGINVGCDATREGERGHGVQQGPGLRSEGGPQPCSDWPRGLGQIHPDGPPALPAGQRVPEGDAQVRKGVQEDWQAELHVCLGPRQADRPVTIPATTINVLAHW